jgi:Helix-turn-helix domain
VGDLLGALKERSGRSYDWLGRRISAGKSTVHRYCTGQTLPDLATVQRLASLCEASAEETAELVRRWTIESGGTAAEGPGTAGEDGGTAGTAATDPDGAEPTTVPAPAPRRSSWRWLAPVTVLLVVALAVGWGRIRSHVDPPLGESRSVVPGGRGWGSVNADRTRIQACDTQADKWGVRTHYETDAGKGLVGDANGADDGCGDEGPDPGGFVVWFQACSGIKSEDTECGPVVRLPPR